MDWEYSSNLSLMSISSYVVRSTKETGNIYWELSVSYFGSGENDSECREGVVQQLLINFWVKISNEDVRSHVQVLLVRRGLIHSDGLAVQLDHVHDLDGVIRILLGQKLDETVTLKTKFFDIF